MKNTLSLEHYGVAALTTREMETTNGGGFLTILAIFIGLHVAYKIGFERGKAYSTGTGGGGEASAPPEQ